ncbi:MAG TPA: hypothetical protein VK828_08235 [Terriglobales bacterium]|jgi:hypothetical protein|nr:hypothetical protein [Terriglobales bacterium]
MRIVVVMFFAAFAFAQDQPLAYPAACGSEKVSFDVKTEQSQPAPAQPDPGKALVYFIQDDGPLGNHQHSTLRVGLDGAWVGAYKHNSYFSVSVGPGEHHVCVNPQPGESGLKALAHFAAEPGKVYYFRTQLLAGITTLYPTPPHLDLDQPDSDQAKYLIASFPVSVSQPKK